MCIRTHEQHSSIGLTNFHCAHVTGLLYGLGSRKRSGGAGMCWCKRLFAPGRDLITLTFSMFLLALASAPASAQFYVRSPEVDKGEAEIEEHGALYSGPGEDERLRQSHEIEGKYGITERFEGILEGELEQPIGENLEGKAIELGGQYEIIQRHGDGFGLAFRTLYEFALPDNSPDEILFGPLARLVRGNNSATINTFFVGQVGDHVEIDGLELKVNWQLKRELNDRWSLGVEGFSEIEDLAHAGSFDEQQHRLGPVAYYEFPHAEGRPEWKAAGGVLFGLSDASSDFTYKFDLEVEF